MNVRRIAAVTLALIAGTAIAGTPRVVQSPVLETAPPPLVMPATTSLMPVAPLPVVAQAISVDDFAASFKPVAGTHKVTLIHPKTCCPVDVCFKLPCGCARKVTVTKYTMRITYPGLFNDVVIRFKLDGTVSVRDA